jgi:hypothetical protein
MAAEFLLAQVKFQKINKTLMRQICRRTHEGSLRWDVYREFSAPAHVVKLMLGPNRKQTQSNERPLQRQMFWAECSFWFGLYVVFWFGNIDWGLFCTQIKNWGLLLFLCVVHDTT